MTCLAFFLISAQLVHAEPMILVPAGIYSPFFRDEGEKDQKIAPVLVDKYPVTNREYLSFVHSHPEWRRSLVKSIFTREGYLDHWTGDGAFGKNNGGQPVTNVSWFAARKYCQSQGKRLLTTAEWEYASLADDPKNLELVLQWYGKPEALNEVARAPANSRGLVGMHGLIWEWVDDFSSAIMAGDSRSSNETSRAMFCGSGSLKAKDPTQYATFMRFAHRSSLRADSVGRLLGFRCARSTK